MICLDPLICLRDHRTSVCDLKDLIQFFDKKKTYCGGLSAREYRDGLVRSNSRWLEALDLPCGQCMACRLNQAHTWANRLMLEKSYSHDTYFLTFTYDNEHLPHSELGFPTLRPEDLRSFNKKLTKYVFRKFGDLSPRYFYCGEYGPTGGRPHYHSIHFNMPLDKWFGDLVPHGFNRHGDPMFISEKLTALWGKGFVTIEDATWTSCSYVARYVTKKLTGDANKNRADMFGKVQEFVRMSNRPGIGRMFVDEHGYQIYYEENGNIVVPGNGCQPAPRYFDKVVSAIDEDHAYQVDQVKVLRATKAVEAHLDMLSRTGQNEDTWRLSQKLVLEARLKKLKRGDL